MGRPSKNNDTEPRESATDRYRRILPDVYAEGWEAHAAGRSFEGCPYAAGRSRLAWMVGWLDRDTGHRLADVFRRNRIAWP